MLDSAETVVGGLTESCLSQEIEAWLHAREASQRMWKHLIEDIHSLIPAKFSFAMQGNTLSWNTPGLCADTGGEGAVAGLQEHWEHGEGAPDPARGEACQRAASLGCCAPVFGRRACQVKIISPQTMAQTFHLSVHSMSLRCGFQPQPCVDPGERSGNDSRVSV